MTDNIETLNMHVTMSLDNDMESETRQGHSRHGY